MASYTIRVKAKLDKTQLQKELDSFSKSYFGNGGKGVKVPFDTSEVKRGTKDIETAGGTYGKTAGTVEKEAGRTAKAMGKATKASASLGQSWRSIATKVTTFGLVTDAIRGTKQAIMGMAQEQLKLNKIQTEFRKVSGFSAKEIDAFTEKAYEAGRATARTGSEMVDASTEFVKMGYSADVALQLAEVSTMYQNIADTSITAGKSASLINAVLKADFEGLSGSAKDMGMQIIDAYNEVANKNAVGTNDLSSAMSIAGSSLKTFGNTFQQSLGIITAGTEILVGSPGRVARGTRSLSVNINKLAQGSKDMKIQVQGVTKSIDLYDGKTGKLRSTYEVLGDIAKQWGNMTRAEQTSLASSLGGKTQIDVLTAILGNWKTAIKATNDAMNSQGSAQKENQAKLQSLEGTLQRIKSAWEQFATSMATRQVVGTVLKVVATGLEFLNTKIGQFIIKASAIGGAVYGIIKLFSKFNNGIGSLARKILKSAGSLKVETVSVEQNTVAWKKNASARKQASRNVVKGSGLKGGSNTFSTAESSVGNTVTKTQALANGLKAVARNSAVVLGGFALASGAIYLMNEGVQKYRNRWANANESIKDGQSKLGEMGAQISALEAKGKSRTQAENQTLATLKAQYNELKKQNQLEIENTLNKMVSGSENDGVWSSQKKIEDEAEIAKATKEYKKLISLQKNLDKNQPGYNAEGFRGQLNKVEGSLTRQLKQYKDQKAIFDDLVASGYNLTGEQKAYYDWLTKTVSKQEAQLKVVKLIENQPNSGISKDFFDKNINTEEGQKKIIALEKNIKKATEGGKGSVKALNKVFAQSGDEIGKLNKETGKWELNGNKSFKQLASEAHMTEQQFAKMLKTQKGNFSWKFELNSDELTKAKEAVRGFTLGISDSGEKTYLFTSQVQTLADKMGWSFEQARAYLEQDGYSIMNLSGKAAEATNGLMQLGQSFGITYDKANGLTNVDFTTLLTNLHSVGLSSEQIAGIIQQLSVMNPDLFGGSKLSIEQAKDAVAQLKLMLGDGFDANVDIKINEDGSVSILPKVKDDIDAINSTNPLVRLGIIGGGTTKEELNAVGKQADAVGAKHPRIPIGASIGEFVLKYQTVLNNTHTLKSQNPNINITATDNTGGIFASIRQKISNLAKKAVLAIGHKAIGKQRSEKGGLSWVGERGAELVQTRDGAYLAGTKGWELTYLNDDDIVYPAHVTKRMLANGDVPEGHFPRYAKGRKYLNPNAKYKKGKQKGKLTKQAKQDAKKEKALDRYVENLKHQLELDKITQKQYYDKLARKIKPNKSSTAEQYRKYSREVSEGKHELAKKSYTNTAKEHIARAGLYKNKKDGTSSYTYARNYIKNLRKQSKISAEEEKELLKDLDTTRLDYWKKEYEAGRYTYKQLQSLYESYYKNGKISYSEYLEYRNQLADEQLDKEIDRISDLAEAEQQKQDLAEKYIDKQINAIDKQIQAKEEEYKKQNQENEALEKQNSLTEAQIKLAKVQNKQVKIYREGKGFGYEADVDEVLEAQKDLQEAQDEYNKFQEEQKHNAEIEALEAEKQKWQDILDMFDEQQLNADIKDLENKLGLTANGLFGNLGTDISKWESWFKSSESKEQGLTDLVEFMEKYSGKGYSAINGILGTDGFINKNYIEKFLKQNQFANGTLGANGGLSLVGEQGAELRVLNRGDGIIPSKTTQNLMRWGKYSPQQWQNALIPRNISNKEGTQVVQNFDKIVLPNVTNGQEFINTMKTMRVQSIQYSRKR